MKQYHKFHMVESSPWPICMSLILLVMLSGVIQWFNNHLIYLLLVGLLMLVLVVFQWWRDVIRESSYQGCHSLIVVSGLKTGMVLFILSEVMLFFSFFWGFFHFSLNPASEIGSIWPSFFIQPFNPLEIPLLNTIILLSSGVSITWAHYSLLGNNFVSFWNSLGLTCLLGLLFISLQALEYQLASFSLSDSVYGSIFFMMTGFHGMHVLVGVTFLVMMWLRGLKYEFSFKHHIGFELAAWYWHFVDVVWLFLYLYVYLWGG